MIKKQLVLLLIISSISLLACQEANSQIKTLGLTEFVKSYQGIKNAQLLDVRTPQEWSQGKIASAKHISFNDPKFATQIKSLDKAEPVFVYCAVGGRSAQAAKVLADAGFTVYNLQGAGYSQLAQKGLK